MQAQPGRLAVIVVDYGQVLQDQVEDALMHLRSETVWLPMMASAIAGRPFGAGSAPACMS
jgi:hypothetical protein